MSSISVEEYGGQLATMYWNMIWVEAATAGSLFVGAIAGLFVAVPAAYALNWSLDKDHMGVGVPSVFIIVMTAIMSLTSLISGMVYTGAAIDTARLHAAVKSSPYAYIAEHTDLRVLESLGVDVGDLSWMADDEADDPVDVDEEAQAQRVRDAGNGEAVPVDRSMPIHMVELPPSIQFDTGIVENRFGSYTLGCQSFLKTATEYAVYRDNVLRDLDVKGKTLRDFTKEA